MIKIKLLLTVLAVLPTVVSAQTLWQRDCVRWWGGDIPVDQRTKENCPTGRNHWDGSSEGLTSSATEIRSGIVITPSATLVIRSQNNTVAVIRSGK